MGVPGFFAWILRNCEKNNIIIDKIPTDKNIVLYIDCNCLIHPECFRVLDCYKNAKYDDLIKHMFKRIILYINFLIDFSKATTTFIAVDGVAPLAKVNQQRKRRYKSSFEREFKNRITEKYGETNKIIWDNTCITPGTEFMEALHQELQQFTISKPNIIYSSCYSPGEGEHKILQHIRSSALDNSNIIYGLDADLIFLSLAQNHRDMYLLRELSEIVPKNLIGDIKNEKCDINIVNQKMIFVSISELSKSICTTLEEKCYLPKANQSKYVIKDFIFICYLLGNDFLPHLPRLSIKNRGLDILLDIYCQVHEELGGGILDQNNNINQPFIQILFSKLVYLKEPWKKPMREKPYISDPMESEIWDFDNLQHSYFDEMKGSDNIDMPFAVHRYNYYEKYFGSIKSIESVCKEYFEGLKWVTEYYFTENKSWDYQYSFSHGPFIQDIVKELPKININKIIFCDSTPLTPFQQLLAVLPVSHSNLLPKSYQYLTCSIASPIIDLFPIGFKQDYEGKYLLYEGIPLIPSISKSRLKNATENLVLTSKEKIRNLNV
jgi:5'-3' exonuclease